MLQLIANNETIEDFGDGKINKTIMFKAQSGDSIIIKDLNENIKKTIETKKVDYDLYIFENSVNVPSIIIKDYFAIDEINIYAYNTNGILVNTLYTQINNIDGFLNLAASERIAINNGPLALGGLAIGVVSLIGEVGGSNTDTISPNAPTVSLSDNDNNGKPTARGLAEANSIVTIMWMDGSKSITTADSNGRYSIEAPTVQRNGDVIATATDSSGNESSISEVKQKYEQASRLPTLSIEDTDGDGKPNAHGTTEPNSAVTIAWPNGTTSTTKADNNGNYSIEAPDTQPNGKVIAMGTDANSSMGVSSTIVFYKDKQPPTATITIDDNKLTINEISTVTITFSEAVKDFGKEDVTVENGILSDFVTTDNIVWTATFTPDVDVEDTTNTITLNNTYTDISNNVGTTATSENYEIDTISDTYTVDTSSSIDTIYNFDTEGSITHDVLDIDDLLQNESGDAGDIGTLLNYIHIEAGATSTIHISSNGNFTNGIYDSSFEDKTIILNNVNLSSFGSSDEEIIKSMISNGVLVA